MEDKLREKQLSSYTNTAGEHTVTISQQHPANDATEEYHGTTPVAVSKGCASHDDHKPKEWELLGTGGASSYCHSSECQREAPCPQYGRVLMKGCLEVCEDCIGDGPVAILPRAGSSFGQLLASRGHQRAVS